MRKNWTPLALVALFLLAGFASCSKEQDLSQDLGPEFLATEREILASMGLISVQGRPKSVNFDLPVPASLQASLGASLELEKYRGSFVVLNFWATWCLPCREEMPALERLASSQEAAGDVVVLAISSRESMETVEAFLQEFSYGFPIALDIEGEISGKYGVRGLPTTYLVSPDGRVIGGKAGAYAWDAASVQEGLAALRQLNS